MIYRLELIFRGARRWLSRSIWLARLLRLPVTGGETAAPGLLLVQIDGLSSRELDAALAAGEMPFLARLLSHEHYRRHALYSGLPSSTPAVQAELFYGVRGAVPAFSFVERASGRVARMYDSSAAARVEQTLARHGEPLLRGGSAYADIYTGGAEEAHFCAASLGWGAVLRAANPLALAAFVIANVTTFVRVAALLVVEFALAVVDLFRGLIAGHDLVRELAFVPARVGIGILLRELVTIGVTIDLARGVPIIHVNYLGYDEQAHRRGPSSRFAHWTLKGIDRAVRRVWRAAHRSTRRHYEVWIYSDHGQEATVPYAHRAGRTVESAVADAVRDLIVPDAAEPLDTGRGVQSQRIRYLGGSVLPRLAPAEHAADAEADGAAVSVVAMGPVGLVYLKRAPPPEARGDFARALIGRAGVPLVLAAQEAGGAIAWTADGRFSLPADRARVLGTEHPYLDEAADDLVALCRHPDAGAFVICGWRLGAQAVSFPVENGAHAGPGVDETSAFALLPGDVHVAERGRGYLRPADLRRAALRLLGRAPEPPPPSRVAETRTLRVMTYNVHSCIGMDGQVSVERIARVIARHRPDVVALQELDVGRARTGGAHQAEDIARRLRMQYHFHPALHAESERYGDAILTHLPSRLVRAGALPGLRFKAGLEPRGALWVAVEAGAGEIQVLNTHLGLVPAERRAQAEALLGPDWLGHPDCRDPVILCGDMNALPSRRVHRLLSTRLRDAQMAIAGHARARTFSTRYPAARIDYVFASPDVEVLAAGVAKFELARVASDHLPVIVDLRLPDSA